MPVMRDGEKWACKQCIQGHRVSGCNHTDRPLQHVNKKGRPVSQCPHCRGLRRSRQTHIKCECGERRHSRNVSSESASLDEDPKCKCFVSKKCICAFKKETTENSSSLTSGSPLSQRGSPMRWIPPRRSEGAVPTFQTHFHGYGSGQTMSQFGMGPYQLGRGLHHAQRSVDSLNLTASSPAQFQDTRMRNPSYDHQFLNPEYGMHQQLPLPQPSTVVFNDQVQSNFPIRLDQTTIDKTLSPHNTKRYSMNDFSMLAGMSNPIPDPNLFPTSAGSEPPAFAFHRHGSHDFAFPTFSAANVQDTAAASVAGSDFVYPGLSRSSSGTTSDLGDGLMPTAGANSPQPVITIDPSWGMPNFDGSNKSAYPFTPSSYQDTPSEYASSPFEEATLSSVYDGMDNVGNSGVNPFSTEPMSGGLNDFPLPGHDYHHSNHEDIKSTFTAQGLPDRSARNYSLSPQSSLDMDFRFPSHELSLNDTYAGSPLRQGWSPMADSVSMSGEGEIAH